MQPFDAIEDSVGVFPALDPNTRTFGWCVDCPMWVNPEFNEHDYAWQCQRPPLRLYCQIFRRVLANICVGKSLILPEFWIILSKNAKLSKCKLLLPWPSQHAVPRTLPILPDSVRAAMYPLSQHHISLCQQSIEYRRQQDHITRSVDGDDSFFSH